MDSPKTYAGVFLPSAVSQDAGTGLLLTATLPADVVINSGHLEFARHYALAVKHVHQYPSNLRERELDRYLKLSCPVAFKTRVEEEISRMEHVDRTVDSTLRLRGFQTYVHRMDMTRYQLFCCMASGTGFTSPLIAAAWKEGREWWLASLRDNLVNQLKKRGERATTQILSKRLSLMLAVENCARDLSDRSNSTGTVRLKNICSAQMLPSRTMPAVLGVAPDDDLYITLAVQCKRLVETAHALCTHYRPSLEMVSKAYRRILSRDRDLLDENLGEPAGKRVRRETESNPVAATGPETTGPVPVPVEIAELASSEDTTPKPSRPESLRLDRTTTRSRSNADVESDDES